jgi:ferredoxin-NADP reductase
MSTGTLALIIFAAILAQVAVFALVGLYRRNKEYRELELHLSEGSQVPGPTVAAQEPSVSDTLGGAPAWEGYRDFIVERRVMEDGAQTACSFYLVPADGQPLPGFKPGQFLTFKLPIPDPVSGEPRNVVRCYSLSDLPRSDYYRITVKRVPAPADRPDLLPGLSSGFFHDQVQEGARLAVKAPSGHFYLMEQEPLPVVLVAGGIGLTPLLSMLNTMLHRGDQREVWLFYGVRNGDEHLMKRHFEILAEEHHNFHLHVCYSRPNEQDVEGVDYQHRGHADINLLRLTLKLARYQFYVCGPRAMMESLIPALEEWGVASADIFYESFGPATLPKREKPKTEAAKEPATALAATVTFSKSGKSLPWDPDAESLLAFAEDNGMEPDFGCRAGSCGTCQTLLISGEVEYSQEPDAEIEPGHCLLCIGIPKGDIKLDL